mgnify:FL=1
MTNAQSEIFTVCQTVVVFLSSDRLPEVLFFTSFFDFGQPYRRQPIQVTFHTLPVNAKYKRFIRKGTEFW